MISFRTPASTAIVATAALLGVAAGIFWFYVGGSVLYAASESGQSIPPLFMAAMYITCPPFLLFTFRLRLWVAPVCNGLYYGLLSYFVVRWVREQKSS